MAKKVLPKAQPGITMSSDQLRREQNRTGKTAEEYYKSEDYARVQRRLDELNARPKEIKTYGPKAQPRPLARPTTPPDKRSTNEKVGITRPLTPSKKGGTIKKKK